MSSEKLRPLVINQISITGTLLGDPEVRRVGEHRHPILTFDAETVQYVGKAKKPETLRWRGKCFGVTAEALRTQLRKGLNIFVRGRLSGYVPPSTTQPHPFNEITVQELATEPPANIIFRAEILEQSAEDKRQQLEEDLQQ